MSRCTQVRQTHTTLTRQSGQVQPMCIAKLSFEPVDMAMLEGGAWLREAARATGQDHRRWEWNRAHATEKGPKGHAGNSREATHRTNGETMVCKRPGCGALVDRGVMHRQAVKRYQARTGVKWKHWRDSKLAWHEQPGWPYAAGDGCSGEACSAQYNPTAHRESQDQKVDELRTGKRTLIAWLDHAKDRRVLEYDADTVKRVCNRVEREECGRPQYATPTRAQRAARRLGQR